MLHDAAIPSRGLWRAALPPVLLAMAILAAGPAGASLGDQITTSVLNLPEALAPNAGNFGTWGPSTFTPRLYLAPAGATRNWVGWTDAGGDGHVSRVDGGVVVATDDFNGQPVCGLVTQGSDGYAVLVRDAAAGVARLIKRVSGVTAWSTPLTNPVAAPTAAVGDSRLAYGNGTFAARFAVIGTADPFTGHHGDQGTFVNDSGVVQAGGWNWGPAHAICELAGVHAQTGQVLTLAVSDCYPNKGILAGTTQMLHLADADCAGRVTVNLGQMVATPDGWLVAFNGQSYGVYTGYGVGLLHLDAALNASVSWLTATMGANERDPVLARLGVPFDSDRYLTGWRDASTGAFRLAVIDGAGLFVAGPEIVSTAGVGWGTRDDSFRTASDGSVRWLEGQGGATSLELHTYTAYVSGAPLPSFAALSLEPNVPNPFNPSTTIAFSLPRDAAATLTIHDLAGRLARTLLDARACAAGRHEVVWDGRDDQGGPLPAGVYTARLSADDAVTSMRMTLLK